MKTHNVGSIIPPPSEMVTFMGLWENTVQPDKSQMAL